VEERYKCNGYYEKYIAKQRHCELIINAMEIYNRMETVCVVDFYAMEK